MSVVFGGRPESATTYDVHVYDLAGQTLYQITDTPTRSEMLNDISVGGDGKARVVWSAGLAGDLNVYAFTFDPPGTTVHEAVFHRPVEPPPAVTVVRAGRVLPVKVEVLRNGVADQTGPVAIELRQLSACPQDTGGDPVDADAPGGANDGNLLRWDPTSSGGPTTSTPGAWWPEAATGWRSGSAAASTPRPRARRAATWPARSCCTPAREHWMVFATVRNG